ncbi:MAG: hypothetical protein KOO66_03960 [Bacteroidales bacterium]|nr:hypothetical protein [Bacteroidales bacterium]
MIDKEVNDKIKIKALLETYSVKDISTTFSQIDNKLMSLHECSADDFLQLNSDFKNLYKQSKIISNNVNTIFDIFNTNKNKDLYDAIHSFYDSLKSQTDIFDQKISLTMEFLEELSNQLRFIFFPLKNFGQNLMSLKYLLANLNLSLSIADDSSDIIDQFKLVEEKINNIKLLSERIFKSLNHLRKISKITNSNFSQVKNQNVLNIEALLLRVKSRINSLEKKYNNNKECIPKIRRKTDKTADSISDIIKKLQYQDIIKQKMEHIQQTHRDLISELHKFETTSKDEKHLNDKAKFFLRIRDIAGLQAAQLIQANKEYQSALEIIVNNFMQVGDNMKVISEMCGNINTEENDDEVKLFNEIVDQIAITEANFISKFDLNKKLNKDITLIDHQLEQSEKYFTVLKNLTSELNQSMELYFVSINKYSSVDENITESLNQVKNLFVEITENASGLDGVNEKLIPIKKRVQSFINEYNKLTLNTDFSEIRDIVSRLHSFRKDIDNKLKENNEISNQALESIKKSISEIKYYDYFEKIIEKIISELNTVNYNLKVESSDVNSTVEENLIKLKEYYTMETEHKIHDQISKGEEMEIDIDSEDDGDIEFF